MKKNWNNCIFKKLNINELNKDCLLDPPKFIILAYKRKSNPNNGTIYRKEKEKNLIFNHPSPRNSTFR